MKKKYEAPTVDIHRFEAEDVVTASSVDIQLISENETPAY